MKPGFVSNGYDYPSSSLTLKSSNGDFTIIKVPKVISASYCLGVTTGARVEVIQVPPIFTLCSALITQNCMKLPSPSFIVLLLVSTPSPTRTLASHSHEDLFPGIYLCIY